MPDHRPPDNLDPDDLGATQVIHIPNSRLPAGHLLAGRFEIQRLVGQGRFGSVYQARDRNLETSVAIKVLHASLASDNKALSEFKREILLLRQLSHPNIVRVHEYYLDGEHHFITMDWIEGESLQQRMNRGKLSLDELDAIVEQLFSALVFAESQQVVHRDLKPENILLDEQGRLYLVDFGLALMGNAESGAIIAGTPFYAAPEYLLRGEVSSASDRYSLGVILFQLCCGRLPFNAERLNQLIQQKQQEKFAFFPLDSSLQVFESVIQRLTSPEADKRFDSMHQVRERWQQCKRQKRSYTPSTLVMVVALLLMSFAVWFGFKDTSSQQSDYNLALLPIMASEETPSSGLQGLNDYLLLQLQQQPNLRLVEHARTEQTIQLLGFNAPFRDPQLQLLSELLQTEYLLAMRQFHTLQNTQLTAELIVVDGIEVTRQPLLNINLDDSELDEVMSELLTQLNQQLSLPDQPLLDFGGETRVLEVANLQQLMRQQQWQQAAEQIEEQLQRSATSAALWFQLGQVYLQQNANDRAEEALRKARDFSQPNSLISLRATAQLHRLLEQLDAANQAYQKLVAHFPRMTDLRFEQSELFIEQQQWQAAEQALQQVVALDANHPFAWFELAKVAIWSGETQRALDEYLVRALVITKKLKDTSGEGDVLNAFGVAYQRLGDLDNALDYYRQGLDARRKSENLSGVATSLSNLASVHAIRGEFDQAEAVLEQSLALYAQLNDDEGRANTFNELGILAEEQGEYRQALDHYRQAMELRMLSNDEWLQAESMNNIAFIYFLLSDAAHADIYWRQAEQLYQKLQDPIGVIRVQQGRAQMALSQGQWRTAYRLFADSLNQAEQHQLLEESLVAKAYLARLGFLQGNVSQSLSSLEQVFITLRQRQDIRGINEFGLWMASWKMLTADYLGATDLLTELRPFIDEQGSTHQQFYFDTVARQNEFLSMKLANPITRLNVPEHTPNDLVLLALLNWCQQLLALQPESYPAARSQFDNYKLSLHHYEQLRLLEFDAAYAWYIRDWLTLETLLNQAEQAVREIGGYWRNFQFYRLRAFLLEHQGKDASPLRQQALQELRDLLRQLPESQQSRFIEQQNYLPFKDNIAASLVYE